MSLTKRSYRDHYLVDVNGGWFICVKLEDGVFKPVRPFTYPILDEEEGYVDTWNAFVEDVNLILEIQRELDNEQSTSG